MRETTHRIQALFASVRQACAPSVWSRGVELSRHGVVVTAEGEEVVCSVAVRPGAAYATVTLWPEEVDWSCACHSTEEVCVHVAAAVIALRHRQAAPAAPPARLRYRFSRTPQGLRFARFLVRGETEQVLETSLAALLAGRVAGPAVVVTAADEAVERLLQGWRQGHVPRERWPALLAALAPCPEVYLDEMPIRTTATPVLPRLCLVERHHGFALVLQPDPQVTEVFANGAVLCGTTLRPLGEPPLTARERALLAQGWFFAPEQVAELVNEVLPSLQKRLTVEVHTARLPRHAAVPPRLVLELRREGEALLVWPLLVYGEPPLARVEEGRLVHLGGDVPRRDLPAERALVQRLQRQLGLQIGELARFTGEAAVHFVQRLRFWEGEIRGDAHQAFALTPPLVPRLQLDPAAFDLTFAVPGTGQRVEASTVLRAWQEGKTLLPLPGGAWAPLPVDWLQRFGPQVADLLAARTASGALPSCLLPDLARLCDALQQPRPPQLKALQALLEGQGRLPEVPLPPDLRVSLRPYQRLGVNWLVWLRRAGLGALLADDMGLGKTLQALCAIEGRTLVVMPTSVLSSWIDEIARCRPGLRYAVYHGMPRRLDPAAEVVLTTYAILRRDIEVLAAEPWDTVVLDEAQTIKNPDSQIAAAAYRLQARFRLALTGTPVENRLEELWSLMQFLNPGLLGSRQDFARRYVGPIAAGQAEVAARLRARLQPFVLRRRKQEVAAELPPRIEVVRRCQLSEAERRVYAAVLAATRQEVVQRLQEGGSVLAALEALLRLRQACCHPALVPGQQATTSTKVSVLVEALEAVVAGRAQGPGFLAVDDLARPHRARTARCRPCIPAPRRSHPGPRGRGAALSGRQRAAGAARFSTCRRLWPHADRRGPRLLA
ncbi:MAG: hypothetical protein KatS3mg131_3960 [Candidatus Tectimicrobiota bacterium]|nr:MAG: hypothetical protein KatS3mg131_3960 [Candidatus Tectomicrobia bacterium]